MKIGEIGIQYWPDWSQIGQVGKLVRLVYKLVQVEISQIGLKISTIGPKLVRLVHNRPDRYIIVQIGTQNCPVRYTN